MPEVDLVGEDIGTLTPSQLVALVDGLDPHSAEPGAVDLDAIARRVAPGKYA